MLIINAAKIYNPDGEEKQVAIHIDNGIIKKITDVLDDDTNENIIDLKGAYITPGFIEPSCSIGVSEQIYRFEGNDANETSSPILPGLRAIDAINPLDEGFKMALASGITTVITGPGDANVIGGTFAAMKTAGKNLDDMIIEPEIAMKFVFGNAPKAYYKKSGNMPGTRMAIAYLIRENLIRAKEYKRAKELAKNDSKNIQKFDMHLESLSKVFDGMQVKITAHQDYDIETAIRIAKEFDLNFVIDRCTEGYRIPELLKDLNIIAAGPIYGGKRIHEIRNRDPILGKVFESNEIDFCLSTGHPSTNIDMNILQAIMMIDKGLSKKTALKAMTINAAKCVGLEERIGSIEIGKEADIVVWDSEPFDYYSFVDRVFINGNEVYRREES
ncbi:MAG: amidohydrolase [Tissierellia bacterium]|nr:amidohydrolase [Tissierellia bacterium]